MTTPRYETRLVERKEVPHYEEDGWEEIPHDDRRKDKAMVRRRTDINLQSSGDIGRAIMKLEEINRKDLPPSRSFPAASDVLLDLIGDPKVSEAFRKATMSRGENVRAQRRVRHVGDPTTDQPETA